LRLAILADVHGNLLALEAVLADLRRHTPDAIVNLGDHLSGPLWAAPTADLLMNTPMLHISGNHDRQLLAGPPESMGPSDQAASAELRHVHLQWLRALPGTAVLAGVYLCHGTPRRDDEYLLETPQGQGPAPAHTIAAHLEGIADRVIACGHSHIPRVVTVAPHRIAINPGSVGLPAYHADGHDMACGSPHARYAILDLTTPTPAIQHHAIEYDWHAASQRAARNGRPDWAHALLTGYALNS